MRNVWSVVAFVGTLALVALAVAGCGGGSDDDSSADIVTDSGSENSSPRADDEAAEVCFSPADVRVLSDVNPGFWYAIGGPVSVYSLSDRFANAEAFAKDARQAADGLERAAEIDTEAARQLDDPDWARGLTDFAELYGDGAATLDQLAVAAEVDDEVALNSARRMLQRQQAINDTIVRGLPRREACEE